MAENYPAEEKKGFDIKSLGTGAWAGICAAALVIGLLIGHFAMGGGAGAGGSLNKSTVSEGELDTTIASYSHDGTQGALTIRQVIEMTSSLESAKDEEGNYKVPSADNVLYAVRNTIALDEAQKRNINPTDEDLLNYAESELGMTPDFESIATSNNLDVDTVKKLLTDSYRLHKLQQEVGGEMSATEPEYPTEPEVATTKKVKNEETGEEKEEQLSDEELQAAQEAARNEKKPEYAEYIIKLAGDEWDAEKGAWKSADGKYAKALADQEVTKDGATFMAAYAAYQVAYSDYSEAQSAYYDVINDFMTTLYNNSAVSIYTLMQ